VCDECHKDLLCFDLTSASLDAIVVFVGNKPYKSERVEQMFVLSDEIVTQVTELREALEKVAMRRDINELTCNWLFSLCETLTELEN
jgi:hypothetical protein